jgi:hypothetical protein
MNIIIREVNPEDFAAIAAIHTSQARSHLSDISHGFLLTDCTFEISK